MLMTMITISMTVAKWMMTIMKVLFVVMVKVMMMMHDDDNDRLVPYSGTIRRVSCMT